MTARAKRAGPITPGAGAPTFTAGKRHTKTPHPHIIDFLGFNAQGDLGPLTIYKPKRKGLVAFLKAPPKCPPTEAQTYQRQIWAAAATSWQRLTTQTKANWLNAAKKAHLHITGHNLFIFYHTTNRADIIRTVERQTGTKLLP